MDTSLKTNLMKRCKFTSCETLYSGHMIYAAFMCKGRKIHMFYDKYEALSKILQSKVGVQDTFQFICKGVACNAMTIKLHFKMQK